MRSWLRGSEGANRTIDPPRHKVDACIAPIDASAIEKIARHLELPELDLGVERDPQACGRAASLRQLGRFGEEAAVMEDTGGLIARPEAPKNLGFESCTSGIPAADEVGVITDPCERLGAV